MDRKSRMESMAGIKGSTAIVTGGAGFIGSHLVEKLYSLGVEVTTIDIAINQNSYYVTNKIFKTSKFEILDIRDREQVKQIFQQYNPEYIFHLAAEPIVENAYAFPHAVFETNIMGTVNVLEAARDLKGLKKIIVASSDKAYGKNNKRYTEDTPLKGDHPYDVSKSAADLISQTYFKTYNLPVIITRFGNVFGEGDTHLSRIIPGICEAAIHNKTLQIRSNGKYVRDYLYVKDVADGYIFLASYSDKVIGEDFNFSSKYNLSVLDVVKYAEEILGRKIQYKILNNTKNEIPHQHLDDKKIRNLGWENKYLFEDALKNTYKWYCELYKNSVM